MNNMKSTGIEWIPFIKNNWNLGRIKDIFYLSKELSTKENPTILSLARSAIKIRDISTNEGQLAESYNNYNSVKIGDLLLNPMDLYSGANCNVSYVEGVISPAYSNLRAKVQLEPRYFDFYFKVQYWTMAMFAHGKGVSFENRWTLNNDGLLNYDIPIPSYEEQKKIVEVLDRKISQVDNLIRNHEMQIEKLKSYKHSVISKSILSDCEYFIPLKYHCTANTNSLKDSNNPKEIIEYVEIGSVSIENGIESTEFYAFKDAPSRARRKTQAGDIIISTVRTYLKAIATIERENLIVSTGFAVLTPKNVNKSYLGYVLKSDYFTDLVSAISYGISYPAITTNALINIKIPMCSQSKQQMIIDKLDIICKNVDQLISLRKTKIEKLEEYRKSLIYEYVIGKKQVS
jgi:type I restriction enzyme S subunit